MDLPELPPTRNHVDFRKIHVSATPDGQYALRILKTYRMMCNEHYILEGDFPEGTRKLYEAMNLYQVKRAEELDRAIAILEKEMPKA